MPRLEALWLRLKPVRTQQISQPTHQVKLNDHAELAAHLVVRYVHFHSSRQSLQVRAHAHLVVLRSVGPDTCNHAKDPPKFLATLYIEQAAQQQLAWRIAHLRRQVEYSTKSDTVLVQFASRAYGLYPLRRERKQREHQARAEHHVGVCTYEQA